MVLHPKKVFWRYGSRLIVGWFILNVAWSCIRLLTGLALLLMCGQAETAIQSAVWMLISLWVPAPYQVLLGQIISMSLALGQRLICVREHCILYSMAVLVWPALWGDADGGLRFWRNNVDNFNGSQFFFAAWDMVARKSEFRSNANETHRNHTIPRQTPRVGTLPHSE